MPRRRHTLALTAAVFVLSVIGAAAVVVALGAIGAGPPIPQPALSGADWPAVPVAPMSTMDASASSEPVRGSGLPPSEPVTLEVPAIGVQSTLQQVGLTAEHTMEVPEPGPYYDDAAWYKHSSSPGAEGPAVIIGHVDSAANGPSVFFDLADLQQGDEVRVARADERVAIFRVDEVGRYPKDDFPTSLVYDDTDDAELRLITCGGEFDGAAGNYRDNVVVFATLVGSE